MVTFECKKEQDRSMKFVFKTKLSTEGIHRFVVLIKNDCYKGLDQNVFVDVVVTKPSEPRKVNLFI
jgi:hypothetical protein